MKVPQKSGKWNEFYRDQLRTPIFLKRVLCNLELLFLMIRHRPRSVIEIGTGTGALSAFLSWFVPFIVAIDNDKGVLKRASHNGKIYGRKIHFVVADAFNLPFRNDSLKIGFSQGFYEHFTDLEAGRLVREQVRVCQASVIINIPSDRYPAKPFGNERLLPPLEWQQVIRTAIPSEQCTIKSRYCHIDVEAFKYALVKLRWHGYFEELVIIKKR